MGRSRLRLLPRSVRARTTTLAVVVVGAALTVGALGLITLLRARLIESIDQTARSRAIEVAAFYEEGRIENIPLFDVGHSILEIVYDDGEIRPLTRFNLTGRLPVIHVDANGTPEVVSLTVNDDREHERFKMRVTSQPVIGRSGRATIYAAEPTESADKTIRTVTAALFAGIAGFVTLVGLLTWYTTRRALAPVHRITSEVSNISDRELDHRVEVPASGDEIAELAVQMNAMLTRVEGAMARQRRFTGDASHELRSPLTSLRTQIEVAAMDPNHVSVAEAQPQLLAELDRLDRLVVDLLTLARSDSGPIAAAPLDLAEIVRAEIVRAELARQNGNAMVSVVGADTALPVLGSTDQLARAVRNVIENAERHATTHVAVALQQTGDHVTVEVTDDGPGIPVADRDRIFERFTRLDESRTTDDGGAGLGLAIARAIVTAHSGTIEALEPLHESGGARLLITLPAANAPATNGSLPGGAGALHHVRGAAITTEGHESTPQIVSTPRIVADPLISDWTARVPVAETRPVETRPVES